MDVALPQALFLILLVMYRGNSLGFCGNFLQHDGEITCEITQQKAVALFVPVCRKEETKKTSQITD